MDQRNLINSLRHSKKKKRTTGYSSKQTYSIKETYLVAYAKYEETKILPER
jgi:hypothetical protein